MVMQPRCCRPLAEVLRQLADLEKNLRKGGSKQLRDEAIGFTQNMAEKATLGESTSHTVNSFSL